MGWDNFCCCKIKELNFVGTNFPVFTVQGSSAKFNSCKGSKEFPFK